MEYWKRESHCKQFFFVDLIFESQSCSPMFCSNTKWSSRIHNSCVLFTVRLDSYMTFWANIFCWTMLFLLMTALTDALSSLCILFSFHMDELPHRSYVKRNLHLLISCRICACCSVPSQWCPCGGSVLRRPEMYISMFCFFFNCFTFSGLA